MITDEKLSSILLDLLKHIKEYDSSNNLTNWCTGISKSPGKREVEFKNKTNIQCFKSWNLKNRETAIALQNYLNEKGLKRNKSPYSLKAILERLLMDATFVYIYKKENELGYN